jgi:hypothetical protein
MRRWIRITLLALGTVLGYGFAIHSMRYHHHYGYGHEGYGWCGHDGWDRSSQRPAPPAQSPPPHAVE